MKVAMMQPSFLPWQGFFELIYKSELFVFLDDFQFVARSYHQRNRLFVIKERVDWYSVPIKKSISFREPLNETPIDNEIPWRKTIWKRIQQNYSKAGFYPVIAPRIQAWLFEAPYSLAQQNITFIKLVCEILGLTRTFCLSSTFPSHTKRSERIAELLRLHKADTYYCARGSFGYMLEDGVFPLNDVKVLFQNYQTNPYQQIGSPQEFIPYLSVLDALMNVGPEQTRDLITRGTDKWLTWDEMLTSQREALPEKINEDEIL